MPPIQPTIARAGGMLRCQPPDDWDLCEPPATSAPSTAMPTTSPMPPIQPTIAPPTPPPPPLHDVAPRCSACLDKGKRDPCWFSDSSGETLAGVCVLSISQHSEGHDHLWCYRHEEEKRPLQRACIGVAESAACTFNSDGYARTGICVDKDDTGISRCEGKPGPGAPALPPADLRGPAVAACTDKALKESCYFSGNLPQGQWAHNNGVCVGTGTLWCYHAGYEKRPSQRACMGKAMEGDACGFDPDGIVRFGTCVARAGGILRCQPPEDWDLCLPPVEPTPPPPVTPKPTIDPTPPPPPSTSAPPTAMPTDNND